MFSTKISRVLEYFCKSTAVPECTQRRVSCDTQAVLRRVLLSITDVLLETEYHLSISRKTLSGYTGAGEASSSTATGTGTHE